MGWQDQGLILERKFGREQGLELLLQPKLELVPEFGLGLRLKKK